MGLVLLAPAVARGEACPGARTCPYDRVELVAAPAPGSLRTPAGLAAAPDGSVVIADRGRHRVVRMTPGGGLLAAWGGFHEVVDVAVSGSGRVYAADGAGPSTISDLDGQPLGALEQTGGVGGAPFATGIAVGPGGEVYLSERVPSRVRVFDADGHYLRSWSVPDEPGGVAAAPDGRVYVVTRSGLWVYDAAGSELARWSADGSRVAVDGAGRILVAGGLVTAYDASGNVLQRWVASPAGVADVGGRLLATDAARNRVVVLEPDGRVTEAWPGPGPEELFRPRAVAALPDGGVLVADNRQNRIVRYDAGGVFQGVLGTMTGPTGIAVAPSGEAFVRSAFDVVRFAPDGPVLASWKTPDGDRSFTTAGIAIAPDGRVLLGDGNHGGVVAYDQDGNRLGEVPTDGARPFGLAAEPDGNLLVGHDGGQIFRFGRAHQRQQLAAVDIEYPRRLGNHRPGDASGLRAVEFEIFKLKDWIRHSRLQISDFRFQIVDCIAIICNLQSTICNHGVM